MLREYFISMVTILIFTFNRHYLLNRSIKYWGATKHRVLISDATAIPYSGEFPANITYLHRPSLSIKSRISEMLDVAKTAYVILCADDDYLANESLYRFVDFLNSNDDYAAVQGLYIRFWKDGLTAKLRWLWDYKYAAKLNFISPSALVRLSDAMRPPVMHYCYSLMRKEAMLNSLTLLENITEESASTFELSFIPGIILTGKYATLPLMFQARQHQEVPSWKHELSFDVWYEKKSKTGILQWRQNVIDLYSKMYPELSLAQFSKLFDELLVSYYRCTKKKRDYQSNNLKKRSKIIFEKLKPYLYTSYSPMRNVAARYTLMGCHFGRHALWHRDWKNIKSVIEAKDN